MIRLNRNFLYRLLFTLPAFVVGLFLYSAAPSVAQSSTTWPASFRGAEVRGGVYSHDPDSPERGSVDINAEFLGTKLSFAVDPKWAFLVPRPHIGATVNTVGRTSHGYVGLTWTYDVTQSIFIEGALGGALNNGYTGERPRPHHNSMGCAFGFHEAASLGYRFSPQISVLATVEHLSNAGLCSQNRGLTNVGLRLGYQF